MYHVFMCTSPLINQPFYYVVHNDVVKGYHYDLTDAFFTSDLQIPNSFDIQQTHIASVTSFNELRSNYPEYFL